jgi:Tol biopolymer transport system component
MGDKKRLPLGQIALLLAVVIGLILFLIPQSPQIPLHTPIIAYDMPGGNIYLMNLDCIHTDEGCNYKRQLLFPAPNSRVINLYRWSPDGKHILFYQAGRWYFKAEGFALIDTETKGVQPLITVPLLEGHYPLYYIAALSRDGKRFIFYNHDEPLPQNIYISNIDGSHQRPILSVNNYIEQISWSPDGRYITYEVIDPALTQLPENVAFLKMLRDDTHEMGRIDYTSLWIANADGTNPHLLANRAINAVWSPDSSHLLYSAYSGQYPMRLHLMSVRPDGSDLMQLTNGIADHSPVWSLNGQTIAYTASPKIMSQYDLAGGDLMLMQPDGSNKRKLTTPGPATKMVWSPDGRYLTYLASVPRYPAYPTIGSETQLFVADVQADQHYQLTFEQNDWNQDITVIWRP